MDQTAAADAFEIGLRDHGVFLSAIKNSGGKFGNGLALEIPAIFAVSRAKKMKNSSHQHVDDNDEHHHRQSLTEPKHSRK